MKVTLTIKNYRCFLQPATVEIRNGFSAFVGVNNAGKSTLMRFLLEFRQLISLIAPTGNFVSSISAPQRDFNLQHVLDPEEVFSNLNESGIEFWFDFAYEAHEKSPNLPLKVHFLVSRDIRWCTDIITQQTRVSLGSRGQTFTLRNLLKINEQVDVNLTPLFEITSKLFNSLYIGPFRNTINIGTKSDYLDIEIGEAFITRFRTLKTGANKRHSAAITRLTADIRRIFEFDSFNIEPSDDNKSLHITINGKPYKQHELGSGLTQFILVLVNASIKAPKYILIDEPELNLHPRLQLDFLTTLGNYSSEGIWFSTHSIGLARSAAEKIYAVRRVEDGNSVVNEMDAVPRLAEFLGEMNYSSYKDLGFQQILLVEGPTEVKTFQQILRKMSKDHKVLLLPLHGRITGDMEAEIEEIKRISPSISALIDSERTAPGEEIEATRRGFIDLCGRKNIMCHALELRATENYFSDKAIKEVFGNSYRALAPYEKLKDATPHWTKAQNWKLAGAMSLEEVVATDLGRFLEQL